MNKQQQQPKPGIPLQMVRFRAVQQFGRGQRAIEIDVSKPGWTDGVTLRWLTIAVEIKFPDGKRYLVGHSAVDSALVLSP